MSRPHSFELASAIRRAAFAATDLIDERSGIRRKIRPAAKKIEPEPIYFGPPRSREEALTIWQPPLEVEQPPEEPPSGIPQPLFSQVMVMEPEVAVHLPTCVPDFGTEDVYAPAGHRIKWEDVFDMSEMSLEDFAPHRVAVAWRFAREFSRVLGLCGDDELLSEALLPRKIAPLHPDDGEFKIIDPWVNPHEMGLRPGGDLPIEVRHSRAAIETLELILPDPGVAPEEDVLGASRGLGIVPPSVPFVWTQPGAETYFPRKQEHDPALHRWLDVFARIVDYLGVRRGTKEDTYSGTKGIYGLTDPELVRLCWPSRMDVLNYESEVILEAIEVMITRGGVRGVAKYLSLTRGLSKREVESVIKLARQEIMRQGAIDAAEDRPLEILRIEDYALRMRTGGNAREEMQALKHLALLKGLTRTGQEDEMKDMIDVIKRVSGERANNQGLLSYSEEEEEEIEPRSEQVDYNVLS